MEVDKKYGKLTIIDETRDKRNFIYYLCKCECGNEIKVYRSNLISGKTKSCGCYKKKKLKELYSKENEFYISKNFVKGITTNTKKEFYIDLDDYKKVKNISWYEASNGYIMHKEKGKKVMQLHRFIMNAPKGTVVDHINHNIKDNRKCNLRICSQSENTLNRKRKPKGITKIQRNNNTYYVVQLMNKYWGCFKELKEAENLRDKIIQENYL